LVEISHSLVDVQFTAHSQQLPIITHTALRSAARLQSAPCVQWRTKRDDGDKEIMNEFYVNSKHNIYQHYQTSQLQPARVQPWHADSSLSIARLALSLSQ